MVHGENTAKMEFRTAIAKTLIATHKTPALSMSGPERLIEGRPKGEIRRKSPGLPQENQGIDRVLAGSERLTRTPSKASERERWATF
jgi:hypothetical protein